MLWHNCANKDSPSAAEPVNHSASIASIEAALLEKEPIGWLAALASKPFGFFSYAPHEAVCNGCGTIIASNLLSYATIFDAARDRLQRSSGIRSTISHSC